MLERTYDPSASKPTEKPMPTGQEALRHYYISRQQHKSVPLNEHFRILAGVQTAPQTPRLLPRAPQFYSPRSVGEKNGVKAKVVARNSAEQSVVLSPHSTTRRSVPFKKVDRIMTAPALSSAPQIHLLKSSPEPEYFYSPKVPSLATTHREAEGFLPMPRKRIHPTGYPTSSQWKEKNGDDDTPRDRSGRKLSRSAENLQKGPEDHKGHHDLEGLSSTQFFPWRNIEEKMSLLESITQPPKINPLVRRSLTHHSIIPRKWTTEEEVPLQGERPPPPQLWSIPVRPSGNADREVAVFPGDPYFPNCPADMTSAPLKDSTVRKEGAASFSLNGTLPSSDPLGKLGSLGKKLSRWKKTEDSSSEETPSSSGLPCGSAPHRGEDLLTSQQYFSSTSKHTSNEINGKGDLRRATTESAMIHPRPNLSHSFVSRQVRPPEKRAVVVGINYLGVADFPSLHGAVNDAFVTTLALINLFDFEPNNVQLLVDCLPSQVYRSLVPNEMAPPDGERERLLPHPNADRYPSRQNILLGLNWLVHETVPGDVLVFYFAGHGIQVDDLSGWEGEGYDEAVLPADFYCSREINALTAVMIKEILLSVQSDVQVTMIIDCAGGQTMLDPAGTGSWSFIKGVKTKGIWPLADPTDKVFRAQYNQNVWVDERMRRRCVLPRYVPSEPVNCVQQLLDPVLQKPRGIHFGQVKGFLFASAPWGQCSVEAIMPAVGLKISSRGGEESPRLYASGSRFAPHGVFTWAFILSLQNCLLRAIDKCLPRGITYRRLIGEVQSAVLKCKTKEGLPKLDQMPELTFYKAGNSDLADWIFFPFGGRKKGVTGNTDTESAYSRRGRLLYPQDADLLTPLLSEWIMKSKFEQERLNDRAFDRQRKMEEAVCQKNMRKFMMNCKGGNSLGSIPANSFPLDPSLSRTLPFWGAHDVSAPPPLVYRPFGPSPSTSSYASYSSILDPTGAVRTTSLPVVPHTATTVGVTELSRPDPSVRDNSGQTPLPLQERETAPGTPSKNGGGKKIVMPKDTKATTSKMGNFSSFMTNDHRTAGGSTTTATTASSQSHRGVSSFSPHPPAAGAHLLPPQQPASTSSKLTLSGQPSNHCSTGPSPMSSSNGKVKNVKERGVDCTTRDLGPRVRQVQSAAVSTSRLRHNRAHGADTTTKLVGQRSSNKPSAVRTKETVSCKSRAPLSFAAKPLPAPSQSTLRTQRSPLALSTRAFVPPRAQRTGKKPPASTSVTNRVWVGGAK